MHGIDFFRRQARKLILRDLGVSINDQRSVSARVALAGHENALMRLPEETDGNYPMQDSSGTPYFIAGVSSLAGTDAL